MSFSRYSKFINLQFILVMILKQQISEFQTCCVSARGKFLSPLICDSLTMDIIWLLHFYLISGLDSMGCSLN